jgi:oligopeptide/dipeptide ABC transporter ATP-binding protein
VCLAPRKPESYRLFAYKKEVVIDVNDALLRVENLKKHFPIRSGFMQRMTGSVPAVDGVDLAVSSGGTLGLVGESGCGKTTLIRVILKLLPPDQGSIVFQHQDVAPLPESQLAFYRRAVQIVFQDPYGSLNPKMTAGASIEDGLRVRNVPRSQRPAAIARLLDMVGLPAGSEKRYPHEFSGGQRQRIGLARALSVEPSLILCDEPISALDVSIQAQIINLLRRLQRELGLSYLFISHDLSVVGYLSDSVAVMYSGQIVEYASTEAIFTRPLHPYTKLLLAAAPQPGLRQAPLQQAPLSDEPLRDHSAAGCRFHPRCPQRREACLEQAPPLRDVGPGHQVRCHSISPE